MDGFPFNVRVYVVLYFSDHKHVLIADELIKGRRILKFPGGGLEFGEGPADCVRREIREELNIELGPIQHLYTTDFFIQSAFNSNHQVISIYYSSVVPNDQEGSWLYDLNAEYFCTETGERFCWKNLKEMQPDFMTFPGDREVVRLLQSGL